MTVPLEKASGPAPAPELMPSQNFQAEYLAENPNAIQNQGEAEMRAYASTVPEQKLLASRHLALEAITHLTDEKTWMEPGTRRGALDAANRHTDDALKARKEADVAADQAAEIFNTVTNAKKGLL